MYLKVDYQYFTTTNEGTAINDSRLFVPQSFGGHEWYVYFDSQSISVEYALQDAPPLT